MKKIESIFYKIFRLPLLIIIIPHVSIIFFKILKENDIVDLMVSGFPEVKKPIFYEHELSNIFCLIIYLIIIYKI